MSRVIVFSTKPSEHLERILEIRPEIIAYDLHPDYFSTKWALQQSGVKLVGVQHHHAHIASCMAENHLEGRVIGFALDGTGYGTDGNIWGGEVLIAGYEDFERAAHFEYVPLPGGAAAIREPWRMAVSYLAHHFGREFLKPGLIRYPFVRQFNRPKVDFFLRMMEQGVNSPLTSSCGRLFDAVAALIGIREEVNYEAQAAIELEMAMASSSIVRGRHCLSDEICAGRRSLDHRHAVQYLKRCWTISVEMFLWQRSAGVFTTGWSRGSSSWQCSCERKPLSTVCA